MELPIRLLLYATILVSLSGFPIYAGERSIVHPHDVSTWLKLHAVRCGEEIEVRLGNGTSVKGLLGAYTPERMTVVVKRSRPKNAVPSGEMEIDHMNISKFTLRLGNKRSGLAFLGGTVGFYLGMYPGLLIALHDDGTQTTGKIGGLVAIGGAIAGARLGSKLGARQKITVDVRP